jgi:transcription factor C subunit 6
MLLRHIVHHTYIIHIASAFPSHPYIISSIPVAGFSVVVDLSGPSYEITMNTTQAVNTQVNTLSWSDHLQGWFNMYPSANPFNTTVGFMNSRFYPQIRSLATFDSVPSCLSVGSCHPFVLVGLMDGSVWACNPMKTLFQTRSKIKQGYRMKLFQHEYRPANRFADRPNDDNGDTTMENDGISPTLRGASRFLHGWKPELSSNPQVEGTNDTPKKKQAKQPARKSARGRLQATADDEESDVEAASDVDAAPNDPSRAIIREPLTRVISMAWNPNLEFSCWAAAALGCGLVRVLDLGIDG